MIRKGSVISFASALFVIVALTVATVPRKAAEGSGPPVAILTAGGSLQSVYTATSPTIDGTMAVDEWQNARTVQLNGYFAPATNRSADLYVMNDATNLYVAIVTRGDRKSGDGIFIGIDTGHDHAATRGAEDVFGYNMDGNIKNRGFGSLYNDGHWGTVSEGSGWAKDSQEHGAGARTINFNTDIYTYEFSHPLSSGDAQDMSLAPGGTVGFRIEAWRGDTTAPEEYFRWPQSTVDAADITRWHEWADLSISAAPTPTPTPPPAATATPTPPPTASATPTPQPTPLATATPSPAAGVEQQLASISSQLVLVISYDPADTNDPWKLYDPVAPLFANDLQSLERGKGYWVQANQAANLLMGDTSVPLRSGWNLVGWLG